MPTKYSNPGYLLIELSICLVLIILISSFAVPSLNFFNQQIARAELEKLNMVFAYLQQAAITSNKKIKMELEPPKTYIYEGNKETLANNIEFNILQDEQGPPSAQEVLTSPVSFKNKRVNFYPNGRIQPGTIYLTDRSKKYLYALTIPVSQVSYLRKYKKQNNKWILI